MKMSLSKTLPGKIRIQFNRQQLIGALMVINWRSADQLEVS